MYIIVCCFKSGVSHSSIKTPLPHRRPQNQPSPPSHCQQLHPEHGSSAGQRWEMKVGLHPPGISRNTVHNMLRFSHTEPFAHTVFSYVALLPGRQRTVAAAAGERELLPTCCSCITSQQWDVWQMASTSFFTS